MTRKLISGVTRKAAAAGVAGILFITSMMTTNSIANAETVDPAPKSFRVAQSAPALALVAAPVQLTSFDQQLISLVNAKRKAAGLVQLKEARGLTNLSVWWSGQMAAGATGYNLQHNSNATSMLGNYGASNWSSWSENVARWKPVSVSAQAIFDAYWASPGHKANILGANSRYLGMGTVSGSSGWTFNTMTFTDKVESGEVVTAASVAPAKPKAKGHWDKYSKSGSTFKAAGWAFSPNRPAASNTLKVTVESKYGTSSFLRSTNTNRSDINKLFKITGKHGFSISVPLKAGSNTVCITSNAFPGGSSASLGCRTVTR